jgi:outer membrane protein assembly factor BamB
VIYLPVHGARLFQLNAGDGTLIRKFEPADADERKGLVYSFPIITEEIAYFASGPGVLYAVDTASGQLRWKLRPSVKSELFTDLATDGRRIFVTSRPGDRGGEDAVIAIGLRP